MSYLEWFKTEVSPSESGFTVTYMYDEYSGTVLYTKYELNTKLMKGKPVYLMTLCDMGDIIEIIHQKKPLTSEDFNDLNMEIRVHSREQVDKYIGRLGKSI